MSEGELLQIEKARRLDITGTSTTRSSAGRRPPSSPPAAPAGKASLGRGERRDRAADAPLRRTHRHRLPDQDDLFDYGPEGVIGKPTGIDIKESKMTLPLIHALSKATRPTRSGSSTSSKNHNTDNKKVREVIRFVESSGGITYATERVTTIIGRSLPPARHLSGQRLPRFAPQPRSLHHRTPALMNLQVVLLLSTCCYSARPFLPCRLRSCSQFHPAQARRFPFRHLRKTETAHRVNQQADTLPLAAPSLQSRRTGTGVRTTAHLPSDSIVLHGWYGLRGYGCEYLCWSTTSTTASCGCSTR